MRTFACHEGRISSDLPVEHPACSVGTPSMTLYRYSLRRRHSEFVAGLCDPVGSTPGIRQAIRTRPMAQTRMPEVEWESIS